MSARSQSNLFLNCLWSVYHNLLSDLRKPHDMLREGGRVEGWREREGGGGREGEILIGREEEGWVTKGGTTFHRFPYFHTTETFQGPSISYTIKCPPTITPSIPDSNITLIFTSMEKANIPPDSQVTWITGPPSPSHSLWSRRSLWSWDSHTQPCTPSPPHQSNS